MKLVIYINLQTNGEVATWSLLVIGNMFSKGGSRISGKGVHMYTGEGGGGTLC